MTGRIGEQSGAVRSVQSRAEQSRAEPSQRGFWTPQRVASPRWTIVEPVPSPMELMPQGISCFPCSSWTSIGTKTDPGELSIGVATGPRPRLYVRLKRPAFSDPAESRPPPPTVSAFREAICEMISLYHPATPLRADSLMHKSYVINLRSVITEATFPMDVIPRFLRPY